MLGSFRTMSGLVRASATRASGTGRYIATPAPSSVSLVSAPGSDGLAGQQAAALLRGEAADVEGLAFVRRRGIGGPGGSAAGQSRPARAAALLSRASMAPILLATRRPPREYGRGCAPRPPAACRCSRADPPPGVLRELALQPVDEAADPVAGQAQEHQPRRVERDAGDHRDEPADDAQREAHDRGAQEDDAQPERMAPRSCSRRRSGSGGVMRRPIWCTIRRAKEEPMPESVTSSLIIDAFKEIFQSAAGRAPSVRIRSAGSLSVPDTHQKTVLAALDKEESLRVAHVRDRGRGRRRSRRASTWAGEPVC